MSRPLRIEYPNAFYHVMNRGASRQTVFRIDDDYAMFLETLKEASKLFAIRIVCYCLMPNHYHLLLQTPKANLSRAMRHLNGVYTQRFNRVHRKDGSLFRGRYKAILAQEDEYLTHLIRYIHLNPVSAGLADEASRYPWSSHKDYLKAQDAEPWLFVRLGLAFFASDKGQALKAYRRFIQEGVDPKTNAFYSKKNQGPILGDPDFLNHIKEKYIYGREKLSTEISQARTLGGSVIAARITKEVSRQFSEPAESLFLSQRGRRHPARLMALHLTREFSGLTLPEIAAYFKINSYKTVNSSCQRFKTLLDQDASVRKRYDKIWRRCGQGEI